MVQLLTIPHVSSTNNYVLQIAKNLAVASVVADLKSQCQTVMKDGAELEWSSFKLQNYVKKLADCAELFQRKVTYTVNFNFVYIFYNIQPYGVHRYNIISLVLELCA